MRRFALAVLVAIACMLGPTPERSPVAAHAPDLVRVALVDSGADVDRARVGAAVDCNGAEGDPSACRSGARDDTGHGTHVARIVAGVAPGAQLLVVRSMHASCEGTSCQTIGHVDDVVAGVRWAVAAGADVVNLSIDSGANLDWRNGALARAITGAWDKGAVVVASTGNGGAPLDDPDLAALPVLFVGALDPRGEPAAYSNAPGTARWAVLAPGGGACYADVGCESGTSMAAAYVSGAAAELVARGMTRDRVVSMLLASARDLGAPGADAEHGAGAVDLQAAIQAISAADPAPPTAGR